MLMGALKTSVCPQYLFCYDRQKDVVDIKFIKLRTIVCEIQVFFATVSKKLNETQNNYFNILKCVNNL